MCWAWIAHRSAAETKGQAWSCTSPRSVFQGKCGRVKSLQTSRNMTKTSTLGYQGKFGVKVRCVRLKCPYLCYCKVEGRGGICGTNILLHFISSRSEMDVPAGGPSASDVAANNFSCPTPWFGLHLSKTEAILLPCLLYLLIRRN